MDGEERYNPDLIADYSPDNGGDGSGGGINKRTLSNDEVEAEIDGIMGDIMDIHILNHPRDRARKKRVFFLIGTVVFATIILIVTLAATSSNNNEEEKVGISKMKVLTRAAPDNLAVLCSITSISTAVGHDECERVCEEAKCCMAAGEQSCFLEKEALCGTYAPCGTLHTQTEAPSTHSTTTTTNNAIEIKDAEHPHGVEVSPPPSNLPNLCSPINLSTPDGHIACETACHHGSCCLSTTNSASHPFTHGSCFATHQDVCGGYESCMNLDSTGTSSVMMTSEQAVEQKCSWKSVQSQEGRETCENLCAVRSCCFANDERNCRSTNKAWCNEYSACEILINPSPTEEENKMGLSMSKKCQPSQMITKEDLLFCENICKPAFCCYFNDVSCDRPINCNDFEFCDHVLSAYLSGGGSWEDEGGYESTGGTSIGGGVIAPPGGGYEDLNDEPPIPPSNYGGGDTATSSTSTSTSTSTTTTSVTTNTASSPYDTVPVAAPGGYDNFGEPDFDDTDIDSEDAAIDNTWGTYQTLSVSAPLQVVCSPENLVAYPGICELRCEDHMCCFDSGPNGCANHPTCPSWSPCVVLMVDNNNDLEDVPSSSTNFGAGPATIPIMATPAQVQERCATSKLVDASGVHSCIEVCQDYLCCFDNGPKGCDTWDKCEQYQSCKFINDHLEDHTQDAVVQVEDACSESNIMDAGMDECKELCEPHKCCFDESCAFGPHCKVYSSICSVVFENLDTQDEEAAASVEEPFTEPPEDLEWRCDPLRTAMDEAYKYSCDHACQYAFCCDHPEEEYSCKESRPAMCKAYAPCFVKYEDEEEEEEGNGVSEEASGPVVESVNSQSQVEEEEVNEEPSPQVDQNTQVMAPPPLPGTVVNKAQQTTTTTTESKPVGGTSSSHNGDINELCSPENKSTPGGLEVCKEACRVMACCWYDDPAENCYAQNANDCLLYENCPKDS